ncbi:DUF1653 domain-containing protein [Oscillospiraceae bacterium 50-16]
MEHKEREVLEGRYYRHFRGNLYKVIGIATHTETEEKMVVYQAQYGKFGLFVRPYHMFAEEIDRKQYPEATQKHRFELVD